VHRVPGGQRKAVFAYREELDAWLHDESLPNSEVQDSDKASAGTETKRIPRWLTSPAVFGALVATLFAALYFRYSFDTATRQVPVRIRFTADALEVFDGRDRLMWNYHFPEPLELSYMSNMGDLAGFTRIADLNGDGGREVLVVVPLLSEADSSTAPLVELDCFSSRGKLLWSYVPDETFQFGTSRHLTGPWNILDVLVASEGKRTFLWVAAVHREWGNSFVARLDAQTGRGAVRFVNTGVIYKLNKLREGSTTYLLAAGFNNEYGAGSLAIMDERIPFAASPQTPGTRHECKTCPKGSPDYYVVFPRSEINEVKEVWEDSLRSVELSDGQIEVHKFPLNDEPAIYTVYVLQKQPTVHLVSLQFSSYYDILHHDLEMAGKLDHSIASCPERRSPKPVKLWTPSAGWSEVPIPRVE